MIVTNVELRQEYERSSPRYFDELPMGSCWQPPRDVEVTIKLRCLPEEVDALIALYGRRINVSQAAEPAAPPEPVDVECAVVEQRALPPARKRIGGKR